MTRDEAIAIIKDDLFRNGEFLSSKYRKALLIAIDALKLEIIRCADCSEYRNGECENNLLYDDMNGDLTGVTFCPDEGFYCQHALRKE